MDESNSSESKQLKQENEDGNNNNTDDVVNKLQVTAKKQETSQLSSADVLANYLQEKSSRRKLGSVTHHSDPILKLFVCMAATVKTFSLQLQIEVKTKISEIVSNAEVKKMSFVSPLPIRSEAGFLSCLCLHLRRLLFLLHQNYSV